MVRLLRALLVMPLLLSLGGCTIYQSIGKSVGPFLHPVTGQNFVHINNAEWDSRNALIYFYRTYSRWDADEIESPSVYIDDKHYFNLRGGGYTWLEVYPGERHIQMRRPLLGLEGVKQGHFEFDLSRIADFKVNLEPGKIYYFRYSETAQPKELNPEIDPESPMAKGDLQLVTRDYAMTEIVKTKFLKSDLLAPNHAATSIAEVNRVTDFKRRRAEIAEARTKEIEVLKAKGQYDEGAWYWPFAGGSASALQADQQLAQLEQDEAAWKAAVEQEKAAKRGKRWWWPF